MSEEISLREREIEEAIDKLMKHQDEIEEECFETSTKEKESVSDEGTLADLKGVRKQADNEIGSLSQERTELFNDLPTMKEAYGELKVVASELEEDAKLVERAAEKIQEVTQKIQKARI